MKNSDLPASPTPHMDLVTGSGELGLTKREMFAMHAAQGLLAANSGWRNGNPMTISVIASEAVDLADALLAELERTE